MTVKQYILIGLKAEITNSTEQETRFTHSSF